MPPGDDICQRSAHHRQYAAFSPSGCCDLRRRWYSRTRFDDAIRFRSQRLEAAGKFTRGFAS
jgi:hypothetical protein